MNSSPGSTWEGEPVRSLAERWGVPSVEAYWRIGSTNDRAMTLAKSGAEPFTVVLASEQTAGRGRRGATWHALPGSALLMSVVVPGPIGAPGVATLLVGLAVAEGLERCGADVGLKWPNDVIAEGRKLGGILCEASGHAAVAGIGINVRGRPGTDRPPPTLSSITLEMISANPLSVSALATAVIARLKARIGTVGAELAPESLREIRRRDVLAGRDIESETLGPCTALEIEGNGGLRVRTPSGAGARVVAGSVRLR